MDSRFMNRVGLWRGTALTVAGALLVSSGVKAAAPADALAEIVVTAEKRSENLQNVPIAITAFTAEAMQSRGITDLHGLSNLTPNVNLDGGAPFSGDSSVLSASIRGIGQDDFAFNLDPGVGVYLDGVYLARTIGANQNLLDVDRIEILKGPQGTLFGRNTIGGAINIVTHTPGDEFSIHGQATVGSYQRHDISMTTDIPISSSLLTTFSVSSLTRDGYQNTIPFPATAPYQVTGQADYPKAPGNESSSTNGGQNQQVIRGKILWHAADNFDVIASADWTHQDQSGIPNTVLGVFVPNSSTYLAANLANAGALFGPNIFGALYNSCITTSAADLNSGGLFAPFNTTNGLCGPLGVGTWNATTGQFSGNGLGFPGAPALGGTGAINVPVSVLNSLPASYAPFVHIAPGATVGSLLFPGQTPHVYWDFANTQTGNKDTTYSNGPSFAKSDAYGGSITLDWSLSKDMQLKSISAWREIVWNIGTDLDGSPESMQEVTDSQAQHQISQEFQLTGNAFGDRLNYVAGLYYFQEGGFVHDYVPFDTGYLYVYDYSNDVSTKSYAGYFHVDYKLTDQWGVTAGGRYSDERKEFLGGQADLNGFSYKISGCLDPNANANTFPGFSTVPAGVTCQNVLGFPVPGQPLRYFPDVLDHQNWNVFDPTLGTQYHITPDMMAYASFSKGFKSGGWTTRLSDPISSPSLARFNPEYDKTYEVGLKSTWFDHHLQANIAVFESKYSNIQLNVQEGPSPVYQNAGDATIKGAEVELQSVLGGGFMLNVSAGYLDAYYTSLNPCLVYNADANGVCSAASGPQITQGGGQFTLNSELPKTPKYKVAISPIWDIHVVNNATIRLQADYTITAHMFNDGPNTALLERPQTNMVNASIHYVPENSKYEFIVGGTNLTDDRYLTVGSVNYSAGEVVGTYNPPREWYATVHVKL
ncbi:MAG TPA: TonB-dependent receptor [Steroidobacteraceae bacterium]|jgi:iron complex outermembrane recepter protein|nr:TonB-dependent receptor [Steroidobacteraceae bacterium]